ncbi:myo-inosose-2 dehydratase [Pokkaliibacter sp. MBI-7]|uniref:Myo-inosose-2 dehydratase n=1 Tax=Proteobacteria bacterium 228 TaxID=2083153 RepID=A0A2S5KJL2_9PROT|nr:MULTISPECIES: myo-inosose-2 dehydratase [Pokkaliibacter]MDH2434326.1 myo-inosose-2 dehydratase [Pokkaliibacter sp. MBI-7]PPC74556.1 myo-inosose-2 dehydratase [Pokkaliibacter plantistimulans]
MSKVQIGINPLTWSNDDMPSLGADTPLEVCLEESRLAGYAGVELGNKFPRDPEVLKPILAQFDRQLVSGWYSSRLLERTAEEEIAALQDHLKLLKGCGSKVMVYAEVSGCIHGEIDTPLSKRPVLRADQWEEFGKRMTQVGDYLLSQGVKLAYHHHMGTVVETEDEVDLLMQHTGDSVGLLVDTGHITWAGGSPLSLIKKYGPRVSHVHCKDIRPQIMAHAKNTDQPFLRAVLDGVYTVPGDGFLDYQAVMHALKAIDYSGWIVVEAEQDPAVAHPLTYAKMGYEHLAECVAKAGL